MRLTVCRFASIDSITLIAASVWAIGFFFSLPLAQPYELARLAALAFIGFAVVLGFWQGGGASLKSPLVIAALLFWANTGLSILWSPAPMTSFIAVCTFGLLPLGLLAFSSRGVPDSFFRVCAAGGGIILGGLAVWALLQFFFLHDFLVRGQVRHPFANPNSYAALLSLGFFPALGVMMGAGRRLHRDLALVLAMLLLAAVVVIGGRAVLLALLPVSVVMIFLLRTAAIDHARCLGAVLAAGAAAVFFSIWLKPVAVAPVERLTRLIEGVGDLSVFSRLRIWESTLAMVRDHFPFGTGFGTFFLYYPAYRYPQESYSGGFMAHSDPLQFAAEAGIAAPLLFYAFLVLAALRMVKAWRGDPLALSVFCGLAAMIVHAHVDFNLYSAPVLALAGLMLGWWLRTTEGAAAAPVKPDIVRAATFALPVLAALFVAQGFLRSEYHANLAKKEALTDDMPAYAAEIEAANRAGWGWNARPYIMAASLPLGVLESQSAALSPEESQALTAQVTDLLDKAAAKNGRLVAIPATRARLSLINNLSQEAKEFLLRALALDPQHLPSRLALADLLRRAGNTDASYEVLKEGLKWRYVVHDPAAYYGLLGRMALERDDHETANAARAAALQKVPVATGMAEGLPGF